jgi:hypothetical protein
MVSWVYLGSYLLILLIAVGESNKVTLRPMQKIILLAAAFSSFVLLLLSQHLIWDCVGEGVVDLVQGRYLIPLLPLLFMLLNTHKLQMNLPLRLLVPAFVFAINFYACYLIYERFYVESFSSRIQFSCDLNSTDKNGNYVTTNPAITLGGGTQMVDDANQSNFYGALMPTPDPQQFGFGFRFNNLKEGDLVEIEALEKGGGAHLVIEGEASGCEKFYLHSETKSHLNKNKWEKLQLVFTMNKSCDSSYKFYLWNSGSNKTFIDDIKFSIKKYEAVNN